MKEPIELELRGATAVVRLARPEVHNAIDGAVAERLEASVETLEANGVRAVIVTGTGERTFCAGGDLGYFATLEASDGAAMSRRMQTVLDRLAHGRVMIAALNGDVIGGGCELAVACHLRIAAAGVRFMFRPVAMGLITGWGGGRRLFRLLGRSAALRLLLLAETIDADEALRLGLVDRVVPRERLMDEASSWAERIAAQPPSAVRSILELDHAIASAGDGTVAELETRLFGELWSGGDFRRVLEEWRSRRTERQG